MRTSRRRALVLAGAFFASAMLRPASAADRSGYVLPDGSIQIVGDRTMEPILRRLNALFEGRHPGTRLRLALGDPPVGIDGIIARVSLLAPIAHDAWESEIDPFHRLNGYRPLDVRIGRIGHSGRGRAHPPSIYVNAANPLDSLTIEQVARIFTTGQPPADLRQWRQLGIGGEWERHSIHVYGTRDDGMTVTTLRLARFGAHPFARHYEPLASDREVVEAVAGDRYGIGLAWSVEERDLPAGVRRLALATGSDAAPSLASYEDVHAGRYPLSPHLHFYVDRRPGAPLDPLARNYLALALSSEGQRIIAELKDTPAGFVPLTPAEVARELAKID